MAASLKILHPEEPRLQPLSDKVDASENIQKADVATIAAAASPIQTALSSEQCRTFAPLQLIKTNAHGYGVFSTIDGMKYEGEFRLWTLSMVSVGT